MRRLLVLVSAIVLLDASFYAAITPLLPFYVDEHDLTKTSAGVLTAAYAAGAMLASLPAGAIAARVGAKTMLVLGLGLLVVASAAFAVADSVVVLDCARFAQGVGGAVSWTGGMALVSSAAPPDKRAEMMGTAFGAAVAGVLLGPVIGAIARATDPTATFLAVAGVALAMLVLVLMVPVPRRAPAREAGGLLAALGNPTIALGAWLIGCSALFSGVFNVLIPLKLSDLGAAGGVIATVFLVGAGIEAASGRFLGRYIDRHGWTGLTVVGLTSLAAFALVLTLPASVALLVALGIVGLPLVGSLNIPGVALLGDGSEGAGLDHAYAYAVMNLVWAGCQAIASGGGGALAQVTTDFAPFAVVAGIALVTLFFVVRPCARSRA